MSSRQPTARFGRPTGRGAERQQLCSRAMNACAQVQESSVAEQKGKTHTSASRSGECIGVRAAATTADAWSLEPTKPKPNYLGKFVPA